VAAISFFPFFFPLLDRPNVQDRSADGILSPPFFPFFLFPRFVTGEKWQKSFGKYNCKAGSSSRFLFFPLSPFLPEVIEERAGNWGS